MKPLSPRIACVLAVSFFALVGDRAAFGREEPRPSKPLESRERVIAGGPAESLEVRHLVLTGSNEEIGRALAEIARDRYRTKPPASTDPLRTRAQRRFIERNFPILFDRMRGVAAVFGRSVDDDAGNYTMLGFTELRAGCSIVHLPPAATAAKSSVVSRDYDYTTGALTFGFLPPGMLHPTARPYLLELHPDRGYASIAMVAYDLLSGVLDGINSEGLTVTMAMDDEMFTKRAVEPTLGPAVGLNEIQALRLVLDTCATVDEAKEALLGAKHYYAFVPVHYLIADRFGNAFVWEYSAAHNREFIVENPGCPLVMTNFGLNQHLDQDRPPSAGQAKNVCKRYSLLCERLGGASGAITEDLLQETHRKVDATLPAAADPSRPPIRTLWHTLYYPEERRLKINFYLHDEPVAGKADAVRVVRSPYLEFRLDATNQGKASAVATPSAAPPVPIPDVSANTPDPTVTALEAGGATVKLEGARVVAANLDKVADPSRLLPLLRKLPDLAELSIANPKLDDAAMALLEGLPKLASLQLYSASIGDEGLRIMKALPTLRSVNIGSTKVTDAGLRHLEDLVRLESLGLRGTTIGDAGLAHLARLDGLRTLNVGGTQVTDAGLVSVRGLTRLEVLILTGDRITDAGVAQIAGLVNVTGLFLGSTQVTDACFTHVKGMKRLTKLNVAKTAVTDAGIAEARHFLPFWIDIQRN